MGKPRSGSVVLWSILPLLGLVSSLVSTASAQISPATVTEEVLSEHVRRLLLELPRCAPTVPSGPNTAPAPLLLGAPESAEDVLQRAAESPIGNKPGVFFVPRAATRPELSPRPIEPHVELRFPETRDRVVTIRGLLDHDLDRDCVDRFLTQGVLDRVAGTVPPARPIVTRVAFPPAPRVRFRAFAQRLRTRLRHLLRGCSGALVRIQLAQEPDQPMTHRLSVQDGSQACVLPIVARELARFPRLSVRRRVRAHVHIRIRAGSPTPPARLRPSPADRDKPPTTPERPAVIGPPTR